MNRTEKAAMLEALEQDLAKSSNAILFGFAGLKVTEVTDLRRQVRGTRVQVPGRQEHARAAGDEGHAARGGLASTSSATRRSRTTSRTRSPWRRS